MNFKKGKFNIKKAVLIIILTIFIPSYALAMEPGNGNTEAMEPGCGDGKDFRYEDVEDLEYDQDNWIGGSCGQSFNPKVSGGKASWTLYCGTNSYGGAGGKTINITGSVTDTMTDGKCARVKVVCENGGISYSSFACWNVLPVTKKLSLTCSGRNLNAYLQVIKPPK